MLGEVLGMIARYRVVVMVLFAGLSLWNGLSCWQRIDAAPKPYTVNVDSSNPFMVDADGKPLKTTMDPGVGARHAALFKAAELEVLLLMVGTVVLLLGRQQTA